MKKLLLILIGLCLVSCVDKQEPEPEAKLCNECLDEPIIYSECDCSCADCKCHHVVPKEYLDKYNSGEIYIRIVGAKRLLNDGAKEYYGFSDWYYTKSPGDTPQTKWRPNVIENFTFEKGYEYVIVATCRGHLISDDVLLPVYTYQKTISKIRKQPNNLPKDIQ